MIINKNLIPSYLRCEYKVDPLGIDVLNPRLSWIIETRNSCRDQYQTYYQILVSSAAEKLAADDGDIWDSGKVFSDKTSQISYSGTQLNSRKMYLWKVRVWDKDNLVTEWSYPAKWVTGILTKSEWTADWIGFDEWQRLQLFDDDTKFFVKNSDKWIWHPVKENNKGKYFFRKSFNINKNEIKSANLLVTADEGYILYMNGNRIAESDGKIFSWSRPQFLDIKSYLADGKNLIAAECFNTYLDKPGLCLKLIMKFNSSDKSILRTDDSWRTSAIESKDWNQINLNDETWVNTEIIAPMGDKPWRVPRVDLSLQPPAYFRKQFRVLKKVKEAMVFISALGLYKLFINGKIITTDKFTPGWTDYHKRVYYNSYNATENLKQTSDNTIGIILADGWYSGYIGWEKRREYYGAVSQVFLQLEIKYEDGTTEKICTDKTWKASYGAHLEADLLMGETYDARKYPKGWLEFGYDDTNWKNITAYDNVNIELNSYPGIPVRKTSEIKPIKVTSVDEGIYIFDLGQNIAGAVRINIDGRITNKITLRFGEMLDEDGRLYTENIRMARAKDTYYTEGKDEEIWEPDFTYHGFRYVEVSDYAEFPDLKLITGIVYNSDLPVTGSFYCSNEKLNNLYEAIFWSQKSNYFDIPTDCPQRDERLGWAADAVDFIRTAALNMDISAFYTKWLRDLNDAQKNNGAYPAIAPQPDLGVGPLYEGAAGWADAGIITPFILYQYYDDIKILETYYGNMSRYMNYIEQNSIDFIRPDYGYGDWLSINAETPKDFIANAFYAHDAKIMEEISRLLNKPEKEKKFSELFNNIKAAFNNKYTDSHGKLKIKTQTALLLSLYFNLLDNSQEIDALNSLIKDIEKRKYHISAGFVGLTYLFPVLSKYERSDIIYKILLNESYPSWLNMLNNGATTMWERWDSWSPEKGFYDPLMNSFNHTSLGVIGEWFYTGVGGINLIDAGYKKILIKPLINKEITTAEVSYESIHGLIKSHWEINEDKFYICILIPVNISAKIVLPKTAGSVINSKPVDLKIESSEHFYITETGSGRYEFEIKNFKLNY